jgi:hypothetical protein
LLGFSTRHKIETILLRRSPDLTNKTDLTTPEDLADLGEKESDIPGTSASGKKKFIEPELSAPVSVVEATKFFQSATSGVLPPP